MKKTLLATTALALVAATASAVDVELYGQVNKGVFGYNDGEDTNVTIVDNSNSSTRMGVKGAQALDNGLTASVLYEMEMVDNAGSSFTQASANGNTGTATTPTDSNTTTIRTRQSRVGLSGNFGGVYVGKQNTASYDAHLSDLAGAGDVMSADFADIGGGLKFRAKAGAKALQTQSVSDLTPSFGGKRENSIRYDSPIFAGFQGRASIQQGGDMDLGVFYEGTAGEFKMAGSAAVELVNDNTTTANNEVESRAGASFSVAHSTGLAGTVAYRTVNLDKKTAGADEAKGLYAKVGYAWDAFEVAADYGDNENFRSATAAKDGLTTYGLAAQMNLGHGVSVAGLYRNFDADLATNTESIDLYGVTMRVKF